MDLCSRGLMVVFTRGLIPGCMFVNKELPNEDWSALSCSRLYFKIDGAVHRGVIDICVFELVLAQSKPEEISSRGLLVEKRRTLIVFRVQKRQITLLCLDFICLHLCEI